MTPPTTRAATSRPKVFGIGFHKTATSSLAAALDVLGYRVTGPNGTRDAAFVDALPESALALVDRYDAFQDNPWPLVYREVDRAYPGSRFVLTVRPEEAWIRSAVRHFGERETPMRRHIYGAGGPLGHEAHYLDVYRRHNADVRAYFAERPGDLLELDVTRGEGWAPLCDFLGAPVPDVSFPHANRAADRERDGRGLRGLARSARAVARRLLGR